MITKQIKILFLLLLVFQFTFALQNAPISVDINANVLYKESIEAGLSYRFNNSISALFTLILNKKYIIGYAYDYKINNAIGNFNSHEFILHVDFSILRNTRWLRHNKCYF